MAVYKFFAAFMDDMWGGQHNGAELWKNHLEWHGVFFLWDWAHSTEGCYLHPRIWSRGGVSARWKGAAAQSNPRYHKACRP